MPRKYTTMAIEMMDEGIVPPQFLAEMCLAYMSESDVEDMLRSNDMLPEEDEEDDGQPTEQEEWESFDPDC